MGIVKVVLEFYCRKNCNSYEKSHKNRYLVKVIFLRDLYPSTIPASFFLPMAIVYFFTHPQILCENRNFDMKNRF